MELERCVHLHAAKTQRQQEIARGEGLLGTLGYQLKGCYKCNGQKIDENRDEKECTAHYTIKDPVNGV